MYTGLFPIKSQIWGEIAFGIKKGILLILIAIYLENWKRAEFHRQKTLRLSIGTTMDVLGKKKTMAALVKFKMT